MEVDELGDTEPDGLNDRLTLADGLLLALGLLEWEPLAEADGDRLRDPELLAEADGDALEEGATDAPKLCIQIIQFSRVEPETFLYS